MIQATEVVKLLLGEGESLTGRLLVYDASDLTTEEIPLQPNPDCPVCGEDAIESVSPGNYADSCAIPE